MKYINFNETKDKLIKYVSNPNIGPFIDEEKDLYAIH